MQAGLPLRVHGLHSSLNLNILEPVKVSHLVALVGLPFGVASLSANPQSFDFFEKKIRPVLVANCYECHAPDSETIESDFLLNTREGIRKGGASGRDSIIPGDVESSQLIAAIRYDNENLQMPPSGKLPDSVIRDFEKWVAMGAPDPRDGQSRLPREIEAETHWSYQPLKKPGQPVVTDSQWPRTRLDHFVLARLEAEKIVPVKDADRSTLIRRATYELIGLPPTLEELNEFLDDPAPTDVAFEKVIDRLLADRSFGERWGRHWLDVARYAESSGYSRNMLYPYAWRYRDWVIKAWNDDLPYDEFITMQIAGDLLPFETIEQRDEQHISTAFLTITNMIPFRHATITPSREFSGAPITSLRRRRTFVLSTVRNGLSGRMVPRFSSRLKRLRRRQTKFRRNIWRW